MAGRPKRRARLAAQGADPGPAPYRYGGPAKGPANGPRAPFAEGNTVRLRSGHKSKRVVGELADKIADQLLTERPDLGNYPEALSRYAHAEARAVLMRRNLDAVGMFDEEGRPRADLLDKLAAEEKAAERNAARMGLDPRSEAQLARERASAGLAAVSLEAVAQAGREAMSEREELAGDVVARVAAEGREREAIAAAEWYEKESNDDDQ